MIEILSEKNLCDTYGLDWTRKYSPRASGVVFARTTQDVVDVVNYCRQNKKALVPSGGRTGLSGGAVAAHGEIVLSLEKMNAIGEVDVIGQTVRVQAGAVTQAVHSHCLDFGLTWPVSFASKGSSQVGGNIATNAGGVNVLRYGNTRNWVLGLEVVTMTGQVLELGGALEKNNTGYDLKQLFIGSEGTLGVITQATLKLTRLPRRSQVLFLAVDSILGAQTLYLHARKTAPFELLAFEYLSSNCLELVLNRMQVASPLAGRAKGYVVLEYEESGNASAEEVWIESLFASALIQDGTQAQTSKQAAELWALRENISESLSIRSVVHKNDVSVPIARVSDFVNEIEREYAERYGAIEVYIFGHLGDGNLHINMLKPESLDTTDFFELCALADTDLYRKLQAYGGSVSAEHGIGLVKKPYLGFSRSLAEIALFREIKKVFDPEGLLNPGKIFDLNSAQS